MTGLSAVVAVPLMLWGVTALTAWVLKKRCRDPDIFKERRWPDNFWRHGRFDQRKIVGKEHETDDDANGGHLRCGDVVQVKQEATGNPAMRGAFGVVVDVRQYVRVSFRCAPFCGEALYPGDQLVSINIRLPQSGDTDKSGP